MTDYRPIDCGLHDKLEAAATLHRRCNISYLTETGETIKTESTIVDIYANNGADYCKLEDDTIIRLDRLQAVSTADTTII
ncbi:MAG: hypothetical protein AAFP03_07145 [Cyanobacteria bacterium J06598_3]